jgi:predicted transcriptional regulator
MTDPEMPTTLAVDRPDRMSAAHVRPGTAPSGPRRVEVRDSRAIRCLVDPEHLFYLGPFVEREHSVADVSRILGTPFARTYVRIRTLERVGLLRKHRVRPRKGRPIITYVAVAQEFDIALGSLFTNRDLSSVENRWHDRFVKAVEREAIRHLSRNPDGRLRVAVREQRLSTALIDGGGREVIPEENPAPPLSWGWAMVRLDDDDARQLQRDLTDLRERYHKRWCRDGEPYVVGLQLAPLEE